MKLRATFSEEAGARGGGLDAPSLSCAILWGAGRGGQALVWGAETALLPALPCVGASPASGLQAKLIVG